MFLRVTSIIATVTALAACEGSNFSSEVKTRPQAPSLQEETGTELPQETGCQASFDYNPQEIRCAIPFSSNDTIWQVSGSVWEDRYNLISDKQAQIISPLDSERNPDNGTLQCRLVPASDVLVYVSHVKISQPGSYTVDNLIDDEGSVQFWKDGDPNKRISVLGNSVGQMIDLESGHYAIVVDARDFGAVTNGMGMSVKNTLTGEVVRRSSNSGTDWCIFRTKAEGLDLTKFVLDAAKCRTCFDGPKL